MPVRRTRKNAKKEAEPVAVIENTDEAPQAEEVPVKKPKIEEQAEKPAEPEAEEQAEPEAETEKKEENKVSKWTKLSMLFKKKEATNFFHYMNQTTMNEKNEVTITLAVNSYVWSQTVNIQQHKVAKDMLADAVLNHFGVDDVDYMCADYFNIGPTPTMLLQKWLGDSVSFSTEICKNEKGMDEHVIELKIDDESVDTVKSKSRTLSHHTQAMMALKYIKGHVAEYIKAITEMQNKAASQGQNGQQECPVPAQPVMMSNGWQTMNPMQVQQMQQMFMQQMHAKGQNSMMAAAPAEDTDVGNYGISGTPGPATKINPGSTFSPKHLTTIFKEHNYDFPISLLNNHCAKTKIGLELEVTKGESQHAQWTATYIIDGEHKFSGTGQGRKCKEVAAVATLNFLKQTGRFDETSESVNQLITTAKKNRNLDDDPNVMIQFLRIILAEEPSYATTEGTVSVDNRHTTEYTTTLDFAQIKGVGKSVNGKKAAKKSAILDWIIKYEREKKCKLDEVVKEYKETNQAAKREKAKAYFAEKKKADKAEKDAKKAEMQNGDRSKQAGEMAE